MSIMSNIFRTFQIFWVSMLFIQKLKTSIFQFFFQKFEIYISIYQSLDCNPFRTKFCESQNWSIKQHVPLITRQRKPQPTHKMSYIFIHFELIDRRLNRLKLSQLEKILVDSACNFCYIRLVSSTWADVDILKTIHILKFTQF